MSPSKPSREQPREAPKAQPRVRPKAAALKVVVHPGADAKVAAAAEHRLPAVEVARAVLRPKSVLPVGSS